VQTADAQGRESPGVDEITDRARREVQNLADPGYGRVTGQRYRQSTHDTVSHIRSLRRGCFETIG
jgi:hypothetical protein